MPACTPSLLASTIPTAIAPAEVTITHPQLRDLIVCPREAGIVNYVQGQSIIEHDLHSPEVAPRPLANLTFEPVNLSCLNLDISDSSHTLLAAGGLDAEIHLSLHSPLRNRALWHFSCKLDDLGIYGKNNNSVLLSRAYDSSHKPWLVVSKNDYTVRIYEVPLLKEPLDLRCCGTLRLEEPVNHSSISPDGRTLLSVGDSSRIYLHSLYGSAHLAFNRTSTLHVPPPISPHTELVSLSTAWSADGLKFAVACQEGVVAIWDIRNTKPMKVLHTDCTRDDKGSLPRSASAPWNVKFGGVGGQAGHEIMTYTESTNLLHVLDARTFETEEIIRVPNITSPAQPSAEDNQRYLGTAGTCFDPTGGFLYVATTDVVAEWAMHGSGKQRRRNGQLLDRRARPRDILEVFPLPTRQSNNRGAARYGNNFWGDDTNRTRGGSAPPTDPSPPRQRNFFDFLRVHHRRINAFQPISLQPRRWNFDLFARRISAHTVNVAAARDEDRYGIAPPTDAEIAAAMQHAGDSSAQPSQAAAGAPQVPVQGPPTQITPGKNSVVSTEEDSDLVGCCGFYLVRRQSTPHQ